MIKYYEKYQLEGFGKNLVATKNAEIRVKYTPNPLLTKGIIAADAARRQNPSVKNARFLLTVDATPSVREAAAISNLNISWVRAKVAFS